MMLYQNTSFKEEFFFLKVDLWFMQSRSCNEPTRTQLKSPDNFLSRPTQTNCIEIGKSFGRWYTHAGGHYYQSCCHFMCQRHFLNVNPISGRKCETLYSLRYSGPETYRPRSQT